MKYVMGAVKFMGKTPDAEASSKASLTLSKQALMGGCREMLQSRHHACRS
jgi:hypothetical protein